MDTFEAYIEGKKTSLHSVNSFGNLVTKDGRNAVRVVKDQRITAVDEPTFARIQGLEFKDGIIEVDVLGELLQDAPDYARGFIGIAFRIDERNTKFEGIYIRPTNGRCDDQVRRNRSVQYFSYPEYKFDRLRTETPGKYETYADMGLNEWIRMKIVVEGSRAFLHLNGSPHPVLVVHDLKHGAELSGGIGLWVDIGTEGYFADIRIAHK